MRIRLSLFLIICYISAHTQTAIRYKDNLFTDVAVRKGLSYSITDHPGSKAKLYLFDLYEPVSDASPERPLVIWMHGGGFKFGSKAAKGIRQWSRQFAEKGYVCAGLNYPLSKKNPLFHFMELKQACYHAVLGVEEAIAYFKKNAALYRIDTNRIILAGNSAGGMIALQAAYSSHRQLAELAQLPAEGLSDRVNPLHIAGVINFWGGLFRIQWLQQGRVPVFSACGSRDKVVTPDHTDTSLYGSISLHAQAQKLGIPNTLKVYDGYSHELQRHFNPLLPPGAGTRTRWEDAGESAADFLHAQLFANTTH